jgi:hypothetical protein
MVNRELEQKNLATFTAYKPGDKLIIESDDKIEFAIVLRFAYNSLNELILVIDNCKADKKLNPHSNQYKITKV